MSNNYQILISKLDAFIRKYYKNRLIKGSIYSLGISIFAYIFFTSLEYVAQFDTVGRTILFYAFFLLLIYVLTTFILIPISKLYKLGKVINHQQAAEIIGKHFNEVKDKLTNVLQLEQLSESYNNSLILASIDQKSLELKPIPFAKAINFEENKKYLKFFLIPFFIFLIIAVFSPKIFTIGTNRLVHHSQYIAPVAPFKINIENTQLSVLKSKDFTLKVNLTGNEIPQNLYIETTDNQKLLLSKTDKRNYAYVFKNVQKEQNFKIYASGFYSDNYRLKVIPNPILKNFAISLNYPKYLKKPNETLKNTGDLIVPEGTTLKWTMNTEDADKINLLIGDSLIVLLAKNQKTDFVLKGKKSFNYAFVPSNQFTNSEDTIKYAVQIIKDKYPTIMADEKIDSVDQNRIYFNGQIADDYGFTKLTFNYQIKTKIDSLPNRNQLQTISVSINKNINQEDFFHFWNLKDLNLLPGDELSYYFEVWDNDGVNGSKSSKTSLKTLKTKTISERDKATDSNNENIEKDLNNGIKDAKELKKELEKKVSEIQKKNEQNNQQQNEYKKYNENILDKQEQLQKLFDELMDDKMKKMMEELQKMMDKLDKNQLENQLEKMDLSDKDLEKELDRSLELFKQMQFEQKLDEVKNKLQGLAQKQDTLSEKTENKSEKNEELNKQQDELNKNFENLKKEIEELKKLDDKLENPNGMKTDQQKQEDISNDMKNSSENLQKNKNKKASESQKNAAKNMKEMSQNMANLQAQSQSNAEDMDALRQLLDNLLHLSFSQEDLMEKYKTTESTDPEYVKLTENQKNLKDDAKMIEDSLFALSKRVIQLKPIVNKEISEINANLDKTINYMAERQTPMAVARQQYVMTSVNNLALLFDEALQQMKAQAQQKPGNGSCNKPGGTGTPKPGISAIKKMQQQLSEQLKQMQQALKEGNKPGGQKPKGQKQGEQGQGGKEGNDGGGMSKSLAQMAAEQAKIRQALQDLKNNGTNGTNGLSKLMEQNETDIVNKRITQETINRQKEILTRLLESEKAEREREWDDKRESKEGKNLKETIPSEEYKKYKEAKENEVELLKSTPPNLNLYYKNKVTQYFQNQKQ